MVTTPLIVELFALPLSNLNLLLRTEEVTRIIQMILFKKK
jgi:hypothetical protein